MNEPVFTPQQEQRIGELIEMTLAKQRALRKKANESFYIQSFRSRIQRIAPDDLPEWTDEKILLYRENPQDPRLEPLLKKPLL